ncbi:hypothetical protein AB0F68_13570 [Micromonospora sp. NPDC023966]|uniref:hypothetical protein n=1 Tax=Micromonospora sp. NPDC023966 TaxID=3154699 RepID=UPI0033CEF0A5
MAHVSEMFPARCASDTTKVRRWILPAQRPVALVLKIVSEGRRRQHIHGRHSKRAGANTLDADIATNVGRSRFNRLKQCRSVATRYDNTATWYEATITIAALLQWL